MSARARLALGLALAAACAPGSERGETAATEAAASTTSGAGDRVAVVEPAPAPASSDAGNAGLLIAANDPAEVTHGYERRIAELEAELGRERERRLARESEWLRYSQGFGRLGELASVPVAPFPADAPASLSLEASSAPVASAEPGAAELPAAQPGAVEPVAVPVTAGTPASSRGARTIDPAERAREIHFALRSLFAVEQVSGLDLLESGLLAGEGRAGVGPVVLRVLDPAGHPTGTLCADRLRLEGSRAARTMTVVLENGYERRAGRKSSFLGRTAPDELPPAATQAAGALAAAAVDASLREGERRILLPEVDPTPWIEALPELFSEPAKQAVVDDGKWDLRTLRAALNQLLRADAAGGYYRVQGFAGVQGTVLRDVLLNKLDREGRLERRLFADRMTIRRGEAGIEILLEDGAQIRGEEKTAFVDGRFRIVLPRADVAAWAAAGVPGIPPPSGPDTAAAAGEPR